MVKEVGFLGLKEQQHLLGIALTLRTPCVPLLTWVVNVCAPEPFPCWRFAYSPRFQFSPLCFCLFLFVWSLPACHNVCDCLLASLLHLRLRLCSASFSPFEGWGPQYKMNHFKCDFFPKCVFQENKFSNQNYPGLVCVACILSTQDTEGVNV